jgi:hypothetical protein
VAYELLCATPPRCRVPTLITLGSPLGMPAILPLIQPPVTRLPGMWPNGVERWINVADASDVVALEKSLASVFGRSVTDYFVHNGATMHDVKPYLTAAETGQAVIDALSESGREKLG